VVREAVHHAAQRLAGGTHVVDNADPHGRETSGGW
jgi:hypothetical protein